MVKQGVLKSALILTICGIICKVLGAVYRVPLTGILGSSGMGMYYLIFPIYSFMLSLSSASLPAALSKLVSESVGEKDYAGAKKYFKYSCLLFFGFGMICTLIIVFLAPAICELQSNTQNIFSYLIIAPAVLVVCMISCFRGYFQGYQNMTYSGVSQIIEQLVKIVLGLYLTSKLMVYGIMYGVMGSILAITLSEIFALIYLYISYFIFERRLKKENVTAISNVGASNITAKVIDSAMPLSGESSLVQGTKNAKQKKGEKSKKQAKQSHVYYKKLIKTIVPFTLGYVIFPLASLIDSMIVVRLLTVSGLSSESAISVFGLDNAVVGTLTNLPIVVSTSLAMVILPSISYDIKSKNDESAKAKISLIFKIATIIILPCVVVFAIFPKALIFAIFGALGKEYFSELFVASNMLIISSIGVLYLTVFQLSTAILQASGKYYVPVKSLGLGVFIKLVLSVALLLMQGVNIYAVNIANVACYFVICIYNLKYMQKDFDIAIDYRKSFFLPALASAIMCGSIYVSNFLFGLFMGAKLAYLAAFFVGGVVYLLCTCLFRTFTKAEVKVILKNG